AVLSIARENPDVAATDVESVTVETYPAAARLENRRPENSLQAKFSLPFAVATTMVNGHTGKDAFTDEAITEPVLALADRVSVTVGEDIAERVPESRGARVRIEFSDGTETTETVRAARGGEHEPFDRTELEAKFGRLVAPELGDERAAELWEAATGPAAPRVLSTLAR
ncbi:MAG: MmgE/PrpD family protein, partial [archaeon]